jgi:gluconolactonase
MAAFEVITTGLQFPEGPIAMPDGSVVLVEIARGTLSRVHPDGEIEVIAELGGGPNGAALGPDGLCYVCNNGGVEWHDLNGMLLPGDAAVDYSGGRIEKVDLETGNSEVLYVECDKRNLKAPNDIVFDANGGFWFTDTGKSYGRTMDRSAVFYAAADGSGVEEVLFPCEMANGVSLSPDEDVVYFAETLQGRIWQFALSAPGQLAAPPQPFDPANLLYGAPGLTGFDSMAIDSAGNVCQATLIKGGVTVISPDGELADFIPLPDPFVTNICFGGEDLRIAYITLAGTGRLIKMEWPRPGLALNHLNK